MHSHQAAVSAWMQELAPFGILTTDDQLKIHSWNEWLEAHSGLPAAQVLGRPLLEVFPDVSARNLDTCFHRALKGEVIVLSAAFHGYLLPLQPSVRETGYAHMQQTARIAPLSLEGRLCGTITIIEDVTEREAQASLLARRHEQDQLLSSSLAHLLRARNPQKMVSGLLPKVAAFLRADIYLYHLFEDGGEGLRLVAAADLVEEQRDLWSLLRRDSVCGNALNGRHGVVLNDLQSCGDPTAAPLKSLGLRAAVCQPLVLADRPIGTLTFGTRSRERFTGEEAEFVETISRYVAIALDRATNEAALRRAKEQLSEHADNLEAKVRERTAKLQDTIAQLESFSYTVAHDLRAPIRALKVYAVVLLDETHQPAPDKSRLYLLRIERAADRLDVLTRDLLQYSTISRQELQLTKVDLTEVVQDLLLLRPGLQEQGVLTVRRPLHAVQAHRTFLQQCLSNLFDNALKFIAPGVTPRLVVWTEMTGPQRVSSSQAPVQSAEKEQRVRIWVEDNGIGIAPEGREKIFGIFERLNASDQFEGTGIGLAIVARAVQRMSGSCGVESIPGQGSRFWLELMPANQ